jgi:hypothetical protein
MISDFTEYGFRLQTDVLSLVVGEVLDLTCARDSKEDIQCRVAVTHIHPSAFGAQIVEMSPEHQERLSRFIEDVITVNIDGTVAVPHQAEHISPQDAAHPVSHLIPILCLFAVIVLVSAITPAIK